MQLCVYVVARDYGFAPNPFHGICSLATCKPVLRENAQVGDWIVGIGSKENGSSGRIIFAMNVDEKITFNQYWSDQRFHNKRPYLPGSRMMRYGDNIYHQSSSGKWIQEDSHHSLEGGNLNYENKDRDTSSNYVVLGREFYYFGRNCPAIPASLSSLDWPHPGHKCDFPTKTRDGLIAFLRTNYIPGVHGLPTDW